MRAVLTFLVAAGALLVPWSAGGATTFVVTTTADAVDASPGDGACATVAGACTLRAAVQEANALAGPDAITLPAGTYALTIPGFDDVSAVGDVDIRTDVTITGAGAASTTIDAAALASQPAFDSFTCFQCPLNVVRIEGVTVTGGSGEPGGAIANSGDMTLERVVVTGNHSFSGAGGLYNGGVLRVLGSSIVENVSDSSVGGIANFVTGQLTIDDSVVDRNDGGGLSNASIFSVRGSVTITDSSVSENSGCSGATNAGDLVLERVVVRANVGVCPGGGLSNTGTLRLVDSTVTGNGSAGSGGGISAGGTTSIVRSTLSDNEATNGFGGAILAAGTVAVANSTLSGNRAVIGGAMRARFARVTITDTTIAGNTAVLAPAPFPIGPPSGGGILTEEGAAVSLRNTILDDNLDEGVVSNCAGTVAVTSLGHNLEDASTCGLAASGDRSGVDALLGALADNGGPTLTHALLPASPAVDAGDDATCPATDQRGVVRPFGAGCDIGAFELERVVPLSVEIDVKPGSRRNQINCRNLRKLIPVAVLTTSSFDARTLDQATVRLDGAAAESARTRERDVDRDGDVDVLFRFRLGDTSLTCASTSATLTGRTLAGGEVGGSDDLRMRRGGDDEDDDDD